MDVVVGIEEVARRAGVSIATVSRAMRGLPNVSDATRDKVQDIADELGYSPDPNASRLASGKTSTLGVVVPNLDSWFFGKVAEGAHEVIARAGRDLMLFVVSPGKEATAFVSRSDLGKHVAGLLLVNVPLTQAARKRLTASGVPAVAVGAASGISPSVRVDEQRVGRMATEHLIGLGHRHVGLVSDSAENVRKYRVAAWRREGWEEALATAGLPHGDDQVVPGDFTIRGGHRAGHELLARSKPPTAVFAASDEMALGVLQAARERGLQIPADLSVVGVDDHDMSEAIDLTTVRQDPTGQGGRAAELLIELVGTPGPESTEVFAAAELVVRGSTAAVPIRRGLRGRGKSTR